MDGGLRGLRGAVRRARSTTRGPRRSRAAIRPLTETLTVATPLILAGLGLGIGFRAGLFNIGAQGQIILGGIFAGFIGFTFDLPFPLHLLLCVIGAALGGALWAGIAGVLKARTGAHEVIVTIMLNNIAIYLVAYLLSHRRVPAPGQQQPGQPAHPGQRGVPAAARAAVTGCTPGFLVAIARRGVHVVADGALDHRLPVPRGRRPTRTPRAPPASR